jgi:hypothetical protein
LSETAIQEYGSLSELIIEEKYYVPKLVRPDYKPMGVGMASIALMESKRRKSFDKGGGQDEK